MLSNAVQMIAEALAVTSYVAARMLSFGAFIAACLQAPSTVVKCTPLVWVAIEGAALGILRCRDGNWEFYDRHVNGSISNCFLHGIVYVGLTAAPFPILRNPVFLGPHLFFDGLCAVLLINFNQINQRFCI